MSDEFDDDDAESFLDVDQIEGVSDSLYEWDLDQVVIVGAPTIPAEERVLMNWYCPDHLRTTKIIRHMAKQYEVSFSPLIVMALIHGYSIFSHKYSNLIDTVSTLDDVAVINNTEDYFSHLTYKPIIGKDVRRMATFAPRQLAEAMGNTAAIVGTSRSHLAGACIFLSAGTSGILPDNIIAIIQSHATKFSKGMDIYQKIATSLI